MRRASMNGIAAGFLGVAAVWASGCGLLGPDDEEVRVRVENGSDRIFDEVTVFLPRVQLTFLDLQPGEKTPYSAVSRAYQVVSARVVMDQDTTGLQVIDHVGEDPLEGGDYTYVLSFFEGNPEMLVIDLEKGS